MYDLLIKNGFIIDGSGSPGIHADLAVKDGKIVKIKRCIQQPAAQVIDAQGLVVAPGFIDSHSHDDLIMEKDPACAHKLEQGITTEIVGMCGFSCAPISDEHLEDGLRTNKNLMHDGVPTDNAHLKCYSQYQAHIKNLAFGPSVAGYVGHNTIRIAVMGYDNRDPSPEELQRMKDYVKDAMEAGALGISLGLFYAPGTYSKTQEAIELCRVAASYGGSLSLHMRNENEKLIEAVEEVLQIVRATGIKAVISHHKASGRPELCWGLPKRSLELIEEANQEGYDVFLDQYPYAASSTVLNSQLPKELHALGHDALMKGFADPETRKIFREKMLRGTTAEDYFFGVMIGASQSRRDLTGVMLLEAAKKENIDPCDLFFDLLLNDNMGTSCINWKISEEDVQMIMAYPRTMIGTDGLMYPGCTNCHPRATASFPRVLGHYVREVKNITLVDAIRKITGMPSMLYGLEGKGLLRVGMDADITIFNADTIIDCANFEHCFTKCQGLNYVIVAGHVVVTDAVYQGGLFGKALSIS